VSDTSRHNERILPILKLIAKDERGELTQEADAMVLVESVIAGLMLLYRPDPRHAAEYLDIMTARVLDRVVNGGQPT